MASYNQYLPVLNVEVLIMVRTIAVTAAHVFNIGHAVTCYLSPLLTLPATLPRIYYACALY